MESHFDEHREFLRVGHETHLNYKEVREAKMTPKNQVITKNISACGLLFRTENIPPALSSIIWVELDERIMNICHEIETDLVMKDSGIFGKVVRIAEGEPGVSYDVGICFLRKKDLSDKEIQELLPDE